MFESADVLYERTPSEGCTLFFQSDWQAETTTVSVGEEKGKDIEGGVKEENQ